MPNQLNIPVWGRFFCFLYFCCCLSGCVPVTPEMLLDAASVSVATKPSYQGLDPGGKEQQSLHFLVYAYGQEKVNAYSLLAEQNYQRIMRDTRLYSFIPRESYRIVVYANREEFLRKTGQPQWSGGIAIGNAILIFDWEHGEPIMAHEMTHVIFNEFMGRHIEGLMWINEGLAVYEEIMTSQFQRREKYYTEVVKMLKENHIPFSQMAVLVPATEEKRLVNSWYRQVGSIVQFMIEHGGRLGFSIFLNHLKNGLSVDSAIEQAFPGLWKDMQSLEKSWLLSLDMQR